MEQKNSELFFPYRSAFGKQSDVKGIYINNEYVIIQTNKDRDHRSTIFIPRQAIAQIAHIAKFKFLFLIFMYSVQAINRIAIFDNANQALGIVEFASMKKEELVEFLTQLQKLHPNATFDGTLSSVIEQKSVKPINKNYWKAVWKGMWFWILIPVVILFGVIVLGALASMTN